MKAVTRLVTRCLKAVKVAIFALAGYKWFLVCLLMMSKYVNALIVLIKFSSCLISGLESEDWSFEPRLGCSDEQDNP